MYVEGTIRMSSVDRSRKIHKFTFKKFTYRDIIKFLLSKENVLHAHCSFYIYTLLSLGYRHYALTPLGRLA